MAQALAWHAKRLGIPCTVIVPDTAPATKLAAIRRFGATIVQLSWDEVWEIGISRRYAPLQGWTFVHPFADSSMMAGNGTIGLEILEDMSDVDGVVIPFGGGGLSAGIATAIKSKRPQTRIYACEPETAAPLAASFAKAVPAEVKRTPSFVDGIGASSVLPEMWNLVRPLLEGSLVVSLKEIASAIRLLVERNRVVAGGAGAATEQFATGCAEVVVLEPNRKKVGQGRKFRPTIRFEEGRAEEIPFPDATFDRVTAVVAFHHIEDQGRALREMRRVLRDSGRLVLFEMLPSRAPGPIYQWIAGYRHGGHMAFHGPDQLTEKVRAGGFTRVSNRPGALGYFVLATK